MMEDAPPSPESLERGHPGPRAGPAGQRERPAAPDADTLASAVSIAADAIIFLDEEQRITLFNDGAERLFGHRPEDVLGRPLDLLIPERFRAAHRAHVEAFGLSGIASRRMGERQEIHGLRKDGSEFAAEASISRVDRPEGRAYTVVMRDISARREVERTLRERERQLAQAQEVAGLGSWEWDIGRDTVAWSDQMYRVFGLEPGEVEVDYQEWLRRLHPDDRERAHEVVTEAFETGRSFAFTHRLIRPGDRALRIVHSRGEVVRDADGRPVRMVGTGQDVTERVKAERRARRLIREHAARAAAEDSARRMGFLAEAGRVLAGSLELDETLDRVARVAVPELADFCTVFLEEDEGPLRRAAFAHRDPEKERLIGEFDAHYRPDPADPRSLVAAVYRSGEARLLGELDRSFLEENLADDPVALEILDALDPRSALCVPLRARGRTIGVINLQRSGDSEPYEDADLAVAERLASKAALALDNARLYAAERRARAEAEEASRLRDEVLAVVSHDLRSPLNSIAMAAELLLGGELPEEDARRRLELIRETVGGLGRLVSDLLDASLIETGRFSVSPQAVESGALLEKAVGMMEPQARAKGLRLEAAMPPARPAREALLHADPDRLLQVFSNLAANAIRHTPEGGRVELGYEVEERRVRFWVADDGEGMAPRKLDELLGRGGRLRLVAREDGAPRGEGRRPAPSAGAERAAADAPRVPAVARGAAADRGRGGGGGGAERGTFARAGLGLAIARAIVEAHGGEIRAESEPGRGSVFHFTIPLPRREADGIT